MINAKTFFLALAAVTITFTTLWSTHRSVSPKKVTWDDVAAEAEAGG